MRVLASICACACVAACGDDLRFDDRAGGDITVDDRSRLAFSHTAPGLSDRDVGHHHAGEGQFDFQWELPELGPLFNNVQCVGCHGGNGRGLAKIGVGPSSEALIRVSLAADSGAPAGDPGGPIPVPGFGTQLQDHAAIGTPEVDVVLTWVEHPGTFGDGDPFSLREPVLDIRLPDGTLFRDDALRSFRQAPAIFGLGLLEAVPEADIQALADPGDADGDGIRGIANVVWDVRGQKMSLGRFGAKANVPTIEQQTAGAFAGDLGVTNPLFPDSTGATEIGGDALDAAQFFVATLGVPAPDGTGGRGRALFDDLRCSGCHVDTLHTGDHPIAVVANQTIHPFTDLLVHDLGEGLADGRPDFLADGKSWRTAPLWGLGLVQVVNPEATYLHDGRARSVEEAILWHGGEAEASREAFRTSSRDDRLALLAFLNSL